MAASPSPSSPKADFGIRDRLEEAQLLAREGWQVGAFIQVLIAAAATSRKRYKRDEWDDGEAFKNFIYDEMGVITGAAKYEVAFPFCGRKTPLEDILYHHLRCQLVHEGEMPESIVFTQPIFQDGGVSHTLHLTEPLGFPIGWVGNLWKAVWLSPENDDLWQDQAEERRQADEAIGDLRRDGLYCRRPNQQTKKQKGNNERMEWTKDSVTFRVSYPPGVTLGQVADALEEQATYLRR